MFNLWTKYTVQDGGLKGFTFGGGLNYVGDMTYVATTLGHPASLHDGGSHRRYGSAPWGRKWNADLSIKNATDKHYYASGSSWGFPATRS